MSPKEIEMLIIEYIQFLKSKVEKGIISPNGMHIRISPIELFMSQNDIILNVKKIRKCFPRKIKTQGDLPYTMSDIQALFHATMNLRDKALICYFSSTGARLGTIPDLIMENITEMDQGCMALTLYENDPEEYTAFLTPEGTRHLKKYFEDREFNGEKIIETSPIFRNHYRKKLAWKNVKPITYLGLKGAIYETIRRSNIRKPFEDTGQKHHKAMCGAFRKFFTTTLNNNNKINASVTEKLLGHRNDLRGTYYNPDIQVRFDNFKLAIQDLTISDSVRLTASNEQKQKKLDELASLKLEMKSFRSDVQWLMKRLNLDITLNK